MLYSAPEPIDYLVIGHLARDLTPHGPILGGTASYSALTAYALGLRAGIVTAMGDDVPVERIAHLPIAGIRAEKSTTFENITTPAGRVQTVHHLAPLLTPDLVPDAWRNTPIVHFGPLVHEIDPALFDLFPNAMIGITPQGWLRTWDEHGRVYPTDWPESGQILSKADAAVISVEDVGGDEERIAHMAALVPVFVVTESYNGARLFHRGSVTRFETLPMKEIDAVGAGDIFAAAFFSQLYRLKDPYEAARFATHLAAYSITRTGLDSVPAPHEIQACLETA